MDLVELLKHPEGKTLEFKRQLSAPDGVLKTLVAFANTPAEPCSWAWRTEPGTCAASPSPWTWRSVSRA